MIVVDDEEASSDGLEGGGSAEEAGGGAGAGDGVRLGLRRAERRGVFVGVGSGFEVSAAAMADRGNEGAETEPESSNEFR